MSDSVDMSPFHCYITVTVYSSIALKQPFKEKIDLLILPGRKKERERASASKNLATSAREQWDPLRKGSGAAHTGLDQPQGW